MLAEIEQRLAKSEPALAARLASFSHPGPVNVLRSPRVRVLASCVALVVVTVVSLIAYALLAWLIAKLVWIVAGETRSAVKTSATQVENRL